MRCSCGKENPVSQAACLHCGRPLRAAPDWRRLLADVAFAAGLLAALGLVWGLDRPAATASTALETVESGAPEEPGVQPAAHSRALRLAVTPHEYDDMGKLLESLGGGYRYSKAQFDDLLSADRLAQYDVVFLTCSGVPKHWLGRRTGEGQRGSSGVFHVRQRVGSQLREALRRYVGQGGTLYVSDWQLQLLDVAFPEIIDQERWTQGAKQTIRADVTDTGLRRRLGSEIELKFDQPGWYPAAIRAPEATTYLQGAYATEDGRRREGPLLIKVPFENGSIVFTSFHNETQNSKIELELLKYLVFTTVTAREEANVKRTMVRGGFSPKERNLLSLSSGSEPSTQEYQSRQAGPLQFVLGFEDQGAELQLTIEGPGGAKHERSGIQTFRIDIPDAPAGVWRYTITPKRVPYPNFPFTLTIGEKQ